MFNLESLTYALIKIKCLFILNSAHNEGASPVLGNPK